LKIKKVLFIEPFDGGSHRAFRRGLVERSRHDYSCLVLPGRFWKWRMRGAAAWFADILNQGPAIDPDLIFLTGFINVADLRGLLDPPLDRTPILLYMHENQLTYPLSPEEEFDFHFGFTNIISTLAADRVVFNSAWHRDLFLEAVPSYLNRMPEAVPRQVAVRLRDRSMVLAVGLDRPPLPQDHYPRYRGGKCDPEAGPPWPRRKRPLILWNHRWEFDKRPDLFAAAVHRLLDDGLDFEVALLGEERNQEAVFASLRDRLQDKCLACGHLPDRTEYEALLARADIVVSCAEQEYFGISVAEAVHAGCYPVLPRAQVYPSLYGSRCQGRHFYETEDELVALLTDLITGSTCGHVCSLDRDVDGFCWEKLAPEFDRLIVTVAEAGRLKSGQTAPQREGS
jgi:glycosyltransferase involved in cell wall biosynthesis